MSTMRLPDVMKKLKRGPQIITLKDAAMISAFTGIGPGDLVVDAGAGSGFLAIYMGNLVRPDGMVVTYEKREDFALLAAGNIEKAGLSQYVTVKQKDIFSGIDEKDVDVITLDMPEPWHAIGYAKGALKDGGYLVSYVPSVEQFRQFVLACQEAGLTHERTIECMVREMLVKERGTRPENTALVHTGYLTFVRKK